MKLIKFNPKHIFGSKKNRSSSSSVSKSDPLSFGSGSSSSSDGSCSNNLKCSNSTPTSVLQKNASPFLDQSNEISWAGFSAETHFEIVQAFKLIDKDGDGKITRSELQTVLESVGAEEPPSEEELSIMFTEVDRDGDGCISLEEFSAISSAFGPAIGSELRDAFDFFDSDRDGRISAEELLGVFKAIGDERCTLEDCGRMIRGVDSNGDGFVCFEDFSKMMERQR